MQTRNQQLLGTCLIEQNIIYLLDIKIWFSMLKYQIIKKFAISCCLGSKRNLVYLDLQENKIVAELNGHTDSVFCSQFSNDNLRAASGSADKTVRIWNLIKYKQEFEFKGHTEGVYSIKLI